MSFIENQISKIKNSGTYLFYGDDNSRNLEEALKFTELLFLKDTDDENLKHSISRRILNNTLVDFYIYDTLSIDDARDLKNKVYSSPNELNKKVFIIKDINNLRKEASNALLKILEEPSENNYFILLSKNLNVLPTIKSRSITYHIKKLTPEELGVDKYVYDFFVGESKDIIEYKKNNLKINYEQSYNNIFNIIKEYEKNEILENKIKMYLALRNYVVESDNLKIHEKINFAENIFYAYSNKETLNLIVSYFVNLIKNQSFLKDKLLLKKMLRYPVNYKNLLINLFI